MDQPRRMTAGVREAVGWCAAVLLALCAFVPTSGSLSDYPDWRGLRPAMALMALAVTMTVPGGPLRRRPLPALGVLLVGAFRTSLVPDEPNLPLYAFFAVAIALCFVAATTPRRVSIGATALSLGAVTAYEAGRQILSGRPIDVQVGSAIALILVIAWLVGDAVRVRGEHALALRERATAQAVTAERLRIARELHDMVAHSIGIIAIQAGVGGRVIDTQPAEARNALTAIEATSRETLAGLRRMLGALRDAEPARPPEGAVPGLADLDGLVAATAEAGVRVEVERRGDRVASLPPDIDLSAFRIVQEAVTNVVRHSGARHCRVTIDDTGGELVITVLDDGDSAGAPGEGYGISGMRERVALLHGVFEAGPRPSGGFAVTARLPLPVESW